MLFQRTPEVTYKNKAKGPKLRRTGGAINYKAQLAGPNYKEPAGQFTNQSRVIDVISKDLRSNLQKPESSY